ncbi:MAG: helicase-related protein [Myxococcota bacterium]|nr:helicase-related protein [Myxococcota bacterium]
MRFEVGSLVNARGREWVVLPESEQEDELLVLRPLGGTDDEIAGIYLPLEKVEPASFPLPDPSKDLGNHLSCSLLRDAVRLGFRSAAGPFRSLARINVEPRPYQLVPLLMALRQDPVRMLIADDVGVGKTIESLMIARELLDRGEVQRMAVLCPPHLSEQWQRAMKEQFHIDAALVLPSTARRLERDLGIGESLFDRHPHVVVSLDYIKSQRRFETFARACPELVIVDEAHTCTDAGAGRKAAQQRHALLQKLTEDEDRHVLLVTATPHSGKTDNFRSLLGLLDRDLLSLPEDLTGEKNRKHRERLARHVVQRRRGDVRAYLAASTEDQTVFPERELAEAKYELTPEYEAFFKKVIGFCRERVLDDSLAKRRQRVRWWSALALLRALSSSPAAAAQTLRNRAASDASETPEEADELGRRVVMDLDEESTEGADVVHGSQEGDEADSDEGKELRALAAEAEALGGKADGKMRKAVSLVKNMINEGYSPILFCRFIPTVEYLTSALRDALPNKVTVESVTGALPPEERERRVDELIDHEPRVLVCTDCLSEGINLQHGFDAVIHYDLSWNPTKHEQREGRVDRYGQSRPVVRAVTYYGKDNPIDLIVRKKLIQKHQAIYKALGIYVPVPEEADSLVESLVQEVFFGDDAQLSLQLSLPAVPTTPDYDRVELEWDAAVERERKSRALFAQHAIKVDEVAGEVQANRRALGGEADVERFTLTGFASVGATVASSGPPYAIDLRETPTSLRDVIPDEASIRVQFKGQPRAGELLLGRTHPVVEGLATHILETALDPDLVGAGKRCGVIRTDFVSRRTTLLLLRLRFHLLATRRDGNEIPLLAEDVTLLGFEGSPESPSWLDEDRAEALLEARPSANVPADLARAQLERVVDRFDSLRGALDEHARARGEQLLDAHRRVRTASRVAKRGLRVEPHLPGDILGVFVYLPAGAA